MSIITRLFGRIKRSEQDILFAQLDRSLRYGFYSVRWNW